MEGKYYYISVDKWNLMESLVTESISPYSFYWKRNFSNSLSRIKDEGNKRNSQLLLCSAKKGNNCLIGIHESLLDRASLHQIPKKGNKGYYQEYFSYNKTIYFRKGFIKFLFQSEYDKKEIVAESKIVFESKCFAKYEESFSVDKGIESIPKNYKPFDSQPSTFEEGTFIDFDNRYNVAKAAIIGYARGLLTSMGANEQSLKSAIVKLKNDFAGLHTDIMVNNIAITNPALYQNGIRTCKRIFNELREEDTNYFDMLLQILSQLKLLANKRALELSAMNEDNYESKLRDRKKHVITEINTIEVANNMDGIKRELEEIKDEEVLNGKAIGQSRLYYKKGTKEYERKKSLKKLIAEFEGHNAQYASLQKELKNINDKLMSKETKSTEYDNTITTMFNRISDILNDVIKKVNDSRSQTNIDLSRIKIGNGTISIINDGDVEITYFNIVINYLLQNSPYKPISDSSIASIIEETGRNFSGLEDSKTEKGERILSTLREFWKYKNNKVQSFQIPDNMPVFDSVMSFFVKPFGFDQIERYMLNRHYTEKQYAFMLWCACKGFADLPKTFTNVLYSDNQSQIVDDFLFE